jgi:hypothetical protein
MVQEPYSLVFLKVYCNLAQLGILVEVDKLERMIARRWLVFRIAFVGEGDTARELAGHRCVSSETYSVRISPRNGRAGGSTDRSLFR